MGRTFDNNKDILKKLDDIAAALNSDSSDASVDFEHTKQYDYGEDYLAALTKIENAVKSKSGGGHDDYSTDEILIGKWVDGSDLYQKTYIYKNIPGSTSNRSFTPDLTGFSNIMLYNAFTMAGDGGLNIANSYYNSNQFAFAMWIENRTFVYKYCWGSPSPSADIYVTIRYTKSST